MDEILTEVESILAFMINPESDKMLSVNEWIEMVRGALQEAQQYARQSMPVDEDRAWLNAAAICIRRASTVRRMTGA